MGVMEIAAQIAAKYGLALVAATSESSSDVVFERVTQRRQTDLEFLNVLRESTTSISRCARVS